MTVIELFENCRRAVQNLKEIEFQINRLDSSGAPAGARVQTYNAMPRGTNNLEAARLQLFDGLCAQRDKLAADIALMQEKIIPLCELLPDVRARVILSQYYLCAMTDREIAANQCLSRTIVNKIRNDALQLVCHKVSLIGLNWQ